MTARPIGDRGELTVPHRESLPGNATATPVLPVILPVIPVVILPREYYPAAIVFHACGPWHFKSRAPAGEANHRTLGGGARARTSVS